jgi:putative oxidoreductase
VSPPPQGSSLAQRLDALFTPLAQLFTRLVFGQSFLLAGLGKLRDPEKTVKGFESLGIPSPEALGPAIAVLEFGGGIFLLAGLGTRAFAFLLACTMVVATVTAHGDEFVSGFVLDVPFEKVAPVPYLVGMLWLLAKGAGKVSLDHLVARRKKG